MGDFFKIESESLIKSRLKIPRSYKMKEEEWKCYHKAEEMLDFVGLGSE